MESATDSQCKLYEAHIQGHRSGWRYMGDQRPNGRSRRVEVKGDSVRMGSTASGEIQDWYCERQCSIQQSRMLCLAQENSQRRPKSQEQVT